MSSSSSILPPTKFRLSAVNLFLTYPQCDVSTERMYQQLRSLLKDFAWAVVCREQHEDGHPHLHVLVHLERRCNLHSPTCLDVQDDHGRIFHGNYQPVRQPREAMRYVEKDGDVVAYGISLENARAYFDNLCGSGGAAAAATKKRKLSECLDIYMKQGLSGIASDECLLAVYISQNKNIKKVASELRQLEEASKLKKFVSATPAVADLTVARVSEWLNQNLFQQRPRSSKQAWIHGPTKIGKTTLVAQLEECCRVYTMRYNKNDYVDDYDDNLYDLIIMDEYKAQKTVRFLNQFVDGSTMALDQKNSGTLKKKNLPVIIMSNYSISEAYKNMEEDRLETLERRFEQFFIEQPFKINIEMQ